MAAPAKERLAQALSVTVRTIDNWIGEGMPLDVPGAKAWKDTHKNDRPRKGGKLPGAGRPKGCRDAAPRATKTTAAVPLSDRAVRLALMAEGKATRAQIDLTIEETKALDLVRRSEVENGRLIASDAAALAWGELLVSHKNDLDGMPQRVESAAGAKMRLTAEEGRWLREIVAGEVAELCRRLMAGEWMKRERP